MTPSKPVKGNLHLINKAELHHKGGFDPKEPKTRTYSGFERAL